MRRLLIALTLALSMALPVAAADAHTGWHSTGTTYCQNHTMYTLLAHMFYSYSGGYHYGPVYTQWFSAGIC